MPVFDLVIVPTAGQGMEVPNIKQRGGKIADVRLFRFLLAFIIHLSFAMGLKLD